MLTVNSDIHLSFEQLSIKFQSMLDQHKEEIERITKEAVGNFDFETVLKEHVNAKIYEGLEKAFAGIDLSESLRIKIWNYIEKHVKI